MAMYDRFTDRARKIMQLASQEAQRFQHEYIGTEHILLGLVKEGNGVAGFVLKNMDLDLRKIRLEVEKLVVSGPEMVAMGKLPQTPRAKKVVEYAIDEALALGHNYVGTEHLLLGLLREKEGIAAQVLGNLGETLESVREECLLALGLKPETPKTLSANPEMLEIHWLPYAPPVLEDVLTVAGICQWNGREWMSRHITRPLDLKVEWWAHLPTKKKGR